jgi:fibronectin-binding autotransporter adhesin
MKPPILSAARRSFPIATALAAMIAAPVTQAATYFWDNNGATAGFGTAAGTWADPTIGDDTQGWSTSNAGTAAPGASITTLGTSNTVDAVNFGNAATGLGAGTITVSGTVASGNITFAAGSGSIVLSGGTINLTSGTTGPNLTVNNASAPSTIESDLTGGLAASFVSKGGNGTLYLSGSNSYPAAPMLMAGCWSSIAPTRLPEAG